MPRTVINEPDDGGGTEGEDHDSQRPMHEQEDAQSSHKHESRLKVIPQVSAETPDREAGTRFKV